jgi:guanylate kinase
MKKHSLIIVSAPSGAGKTTLVARLVELLGVTHGLKRLVTYATRAPRAGEIPGQDYIFISPQEFEQKIQAGFFLEWSGALGTQYGTGRDIMDHLTQGPGVLILDQDGARKLKKPLGATLIWVTVPSIEILEQRLRARGTENDAQITRRMARAAQEIAREKQEKLYDHHVENDDLELAIENMAKVARAVFVERDTKRIKNLLTRDVAHV